MGQTKAAQALAKITITTAPEMAFPGERVSVGDVRFWNEGCRRWAWQRKVAELARRSFMIPLSGSADL